MNPFIAFASQFGHLSNHDIKILADKSELIKLKKGQYFSEVGKIPRQMGFVLKGVMRICHYSLAGDEITTYFIDENRLMVDYENFENDHPSKDYLQAVTDCSILVFSKKNWLELGQLIKGWDKIVAKAVQKAFHIHLERRTALIAEDANMRYQSFIEQFPNIINRVPHRYVASYLGITRYSLSRIRKNIR